MPNPQRASIELDVANTVATILSHYGQTSLMYLTAEFAPFSDQFRPDIVFIPLLGPHAGSVYFVELKMSNPRFARPEYFRNLPEHKAFVRESTEAPGFNYGFATDQKIDKESRTWLSNHDIHSLDEVTNGEDLAERIRRWSQSD